MLSLKTSMEFLSDFYSRFVRDETPRLAASLAFYTLFALAPLLLLIMSIASSLGLERKIGLVDRVEALLSPQAADAVQVVVAAAGNRGNWESLIELSGGIVWLFSASLLFSELRAALNRIFTEAEPAVSSNGIQQDIIAFLKTRIFSLVMVFAFSLIAIGSLLVSSYLAFIVRNQPAFFIQCLNIAVSSLVYFAIFLLAYRYVPDRKISLRRAMFGAAMTSILFVIGKELIGLYLGQAAFGSAYGAAGSFVVLLVWVYYSSLIVFAGAQLTMILVPEKRKYAERALFLDI